MSNLSHSSATSDDCSHPRLVLRLGFAGRQTLNDVEESRLAASLSKVFGIIGHRLASLTPGIPVEAGLEPNVSAFYSTECPLLRLVTGLCQGSDAVAGRVIDEVKIAPDDGAECGCHTACLQTELAAVISFDVETYRKSRPPDFRQEFDRQLAKCAWVIELDGIYDKPDPDTKYAKHRRGRAYRSQSAFLLRQSDVFIAATDPDAEGKAGGTMETVRAALAFELPVVFIHTGRESANIYLIEPEDDFDSVLAGKPTDEDTLLLTLRNWVTQLTADPDSGLDPAEHSQEAGKNSSEAALEEFFKDTAQLENDSHRLLFRLRKWTWSWFESHFRIGERPKSDMPLEPYLAYRKRATALNYHYSGLYRGAFLLNYILAVLAVTIAAGSLVLLGISGHSPDVDSIKNLAEASGHTKTEAASSDHGPTWLLPVLLVLTVIKLAFVAFISRNTRKANRENWNDMAVDYRYLAERLRAMFYLPLAGSFQPPAAAPPQFASRVVRQSAVDWLFDAIVRSSSPADTAGAMLREFPSHDGKSSVTVSKLITLRPSTVAAQVRDSWIGEQAKYHEQNARTMHGLHHRMEKTAEILGWTVVVVVVLDLLIIGGEILHLLPHELEPFAQGATPWLVFVSAVLPAVIAALGGIRFQSECQRLAERSAVMRVMLKGRSEASEGEEGGRWKFADGVVKRIIAAETHPDTDPGSWSYDVLRLTEFVATDFVQEAAEWSVLYAKEVSDPG